MTQIEEIAIIPSDCDSVLIKNPYELNPILLKYFPTNVEECKHFIEGLNPFIGFNNSFKVLKSNNSPNHGKFIMIHNIPMEEDLEEQTSLAIGMLKNNQLDGPYLLYNKYEGKIYNICYGNFINGQSNGIFYTINDRSVRDNTYIDNILVGTSEEYVTDEDLINQDFSIEQDYDINNIQLNDMVSIQIYNTAKVSSYVQHEYVNNKHLKTRYSINSTGQAVLMGLIKTI